VSAETAAGSAFSFTDPPSWHTAAPSWERPGSEDAVTARSAPPRVAERRARSRAGFLQRHGRKRVGPNLAQARDRQLVARIAQPVRGSRTIAVVSTKGGVGKTSTALNLGHTLAGLRDDRVVAVDADPDAGSLAYRIPRETRCTVADLLDDLRGFDAGDVAYDDIRHYTSRASSYLQVLASPADPYASRMLGRREYEQALELLRRHFALIVADCGTGVFDPITQGMVEAADHLVLVTTPSIDAARAVSFLLDWLTEHGHDRLVERAVLVMNAVAPRTGPVNLLEMERHFARQVSCIARIPWDPHLETGARTTMDDLRPETRRAYLHLAAAVADHFSDRV
jgi:putative peptide zinc metalloprotease protein